MSETPQSVIDVNNLEVVYGSAAQALFGVSLKVTEGSIITLLGPNGSGKTTFIRAITGLLSYQSGQITGGEISFFQKPVKNVKRLNPLSVTQMGIALVPEGRGILAELTVEENLRIGGISVSNAGTVKNSLERAFEMFPVLKDRAKTAAGYLSGGEQQMLALGRSLMSSPRLVIMDEPSLGLAPIIVSTIQDLIVQINEAGTAVLLVEQNVKMALDISNWGYVLERGKVARQGSAKSLKEDEEVKKLYLGIEV